MNVYVTRSRTLDLILCVALALLIAVTSVRLRVYYVVDPRMVEPNPSGTADVNVAPGSERPQ